MWVYFVRQKTLLHSERNKIAVVNATLWFSSTGPFTQDSSIPLKHPEGFMTAFLGAIARRKDYLEYDDEKKFTMHLSDAVDDEPVNHGDDTAGVDFDSM
jgi:hypothetical protein